MSYPPASEVSREVANLTERLTLRYFVRKMAGRAKEVAETFNEFFINKVEDLKNNIKNFLLLNLNKNNNLNLESTV